MSDQVESTGTPLCRNKDCTVKDTGICVLGHIDFTADCPEFVGESVEREFDNPLRDVSVPDGAVRSFDENHRKFWAGQELGYRDAKEIMSAFPTHLIGLVGLSDVGKTCYLNSLFLLACSSDHRLKHFRFAGSRTLFGFEARVINTREWDKGQLPVKLSERTRISDLRESGFMHLSLDCIDEPEKRYEILVTDLPGEWFDWLIDNEDNAERLDFLKRADGILFFVSGEHLSNNQTRHLEIQRARILLGRLVEAVGIPKSVPLVIVVSKADTAEDPFNTDYSNLNELIDAAVGYGFEPITLFIASFSSKPGVIESGYNVEEALIDVLGGARIKEAPMAPLSPASSTLNRSFAKYRGKMRGHHNG